jgi:GT2 family glycosyltransferase
MPGPLEATRNCAVVIPTRERPEPLRALLSSLSVHAGPRLAEVVVVDDSPSPTVRREEFPELDLRVVRLQERSFISHARNVGLGHVSSEFVYVVDDDNVCDPTTLSDPLSRLESDRHTVALMPSVIYHRAPEMVWVYSTPFRPGRWGFELTGRNRPRDAAWEDRLLPTDALPNAAVFRRDALAAVGGYDERMPVSSTADVCQRLKAAGGSVWADTYARTRHDVEPPTVKWFWAAHSTDPARQYFDKHDWYVLQGRVHRGEAGFSARALAHSAPFLATSLLAFLLRRNAPTTSLALAMGRGVVGGLRDAGREEDLPGYSPSG